MAAPTATLTAGAGTITATGEANGFLIPVDSYAKSPRLRLGISGTFVGVTLAVRGSLRGVTGATYYPLPGRKLTDGSPVANSAAISLADSTPVVFDFDVSGLGDVEVYAIAGTLTDFDVEAVVAPLTDDYRPLIVSAVMTPTPLAAIADPGNGGAIPVTASGYVPIVTAGSETRTLAAPSFVGQELLLYVKTDGGTCVITVASAINQTGNNTITTAEVRDVIRLVAIESGSSKVWHVVSNDGAALSTV